MATVNEEKVKKSRKQNISASEIALLTEKMESMSVLQSKLTNTITNQRKNEVWKAIAAAINAVGVESRSVQEVKDKWKNLQSAAKR